MFPEGRALEFLLAAVIALVVVGPKDLPILMRKVGQFIGKMRAMAAEFRASFDEMARQSELDELRKEVEAMRRAQFADVASHGPAEVHDAVADIQQNLTGVGAELGGTATPPPYYPAPTEPVVTTPAEPAAEAAPAPRPRAKRSAKAESSAPRKTAAKPRARKTAEPGE
jgi:sec-independent protein translocase protein TatB